MADEKNFYQHFVQHIKENGLARTVNFYVEINLNKAWWRPPYKSPYPTADSTRQISLLCKDAVLPKKLISTIDYSPRIGEIYKIANFESFEQVLPLTFYCSSDMREKIFFERWMGMVVDPITRIPNYYDEYAKGNTVKVWVLPKTLAGIMPTGDVTANPNSVTREPLKQYPIYYVQFNDCYPVNIDQIDLSNESESLMEMDVELSYKDVSSIVYADFEAVYRRQAAAPATEVNFQSGNIGNGGIGGISIQNWQGIRNNNSVNYFSQ